MTETLIVTNGESAVEAILAAGIDAKVIAWNDVLHEGPVPQTPTLEDLSAVRVEYLSRSGWGDSEEERARVHEAFKKRDATIVSAGAHPEVVLWFEHDLYDQLQLLQILDWFSTDEARVPEKLQIICHEAYIGEQTSDTLRSYFVNRKSLPPTALSSGAKAWSRFTSTNPTQLESVFNSDNQDLPFVARALRRLAEEYPSTENGLSRNERQILEETGDEDVLLGALFRKCQERERDKYLGDWSFWKIVRGLVNAPRPLLKMADGGPFDDSDAENVADLIAGRKVERTADGDRIVHELDDHVRLNGINKWLGGVHLTPDHMYRYDKSALRFVREAQ